METFLPDSSGALFPPVLFPVLLHLLQAFAGVGGAVVSRIHVGLVYDHQGLLYVVLHGRHGGTDGRAAEAVRDQAEVRQAVLDIRLQDRGGPVVPSGRSVLVQEFCEFFTHLPVKTVGTQL